MSKERPILFSAPMVRAILDGSKTQTRRVVKPQRDPDFGCELSPGEIAGEVNGMTCRIRSPYGVPGDRLWVRETFMDLNGTGVEHRDDLGLRQRYAFAADCPPGSYGDEARKDYGLKWRPSIHMPRAASRIDLEITSVRVERLQDISRGDAMAEGCPFPNMAQGDDPRQWYAELWNQINGVGSWEANPWVWVVEFRKAMTKE